MLGHSLSPPRRARRRSSMGRTKRTDAELLAEETAVIRCLEEVCWRNKVPMQIPQLPFNCRTADDVSAIFPGTLEAILC